MRVALRVRVGLRLEVGVGLRVKINLTFKVRLIESEGERGNKDVGSVLARAGVMALK